MPNITEQYIDADGSLHLRGSDGTEAVILPADVLAWYNAGRNYTDACTQIYATLEDILGSDQFSENKVAVVFSTTTGRITSCTLVN